jgi:hypothetical protein
MDGVEDESQLRLDGAFDKSDEEINGVGVDASPFTFLEVKDSAAYVSC